MNDFIKIAVPFIRTDDFIVPRFTLMSKDLSVDIRISPKPKTEEEVNIVITELMLCIGEQT